MSKRLSSRKPSSPRKFADTSQNRRAIQRLVRNVFPRCDAQYVEGSGKAALSFQIVDRSGTAKTRVIKVYPYHHPELNRTWLLRQVKYAGGPQGGAPRLPLD